jgi:quercetin dioxygenase-like cupin family protein
MMKKVIVKASEGNMISILGDHQVIKLTGEETDGQVTVIMQEIPEGVGVPMHVHANEAENFHIIEGELTVIVDGEQVVLHEGDMIHLPKNIPHAIKNESGQITKLRLSLYPAGIEKMFYELSELPAGPPDLAKVTEICGRFGVSFV